LQSADVKAPQRQEEKENKSFMLLLRITHYNTTSVLLKARAILKIMTLHTAS